MKKRPNKITPGGFIWTLSIIHLGLFVGPLVFGIIAYRESEVTNLGFSGMDDLYMIVVPVFATVSIVLGNFIFIQTIRNIPRTSSLKRKLEQYQTASIIRFGLAVAPVLFGIISFLITQNLLFLLFSGIILLYFLILRPTKKKIEDTLSLTGSDRKQFNKLNQPL
ncbi:MAG: hypothetical protein AB3N18_03840 [Allomuricauda sp.]